MLFDDVNKPPADDPPPGAPRRRRRGSASSSSGGREGGVRRRRRSGGGSRSSFHEAARLDQAAPASGRSNHIAWLWVLGLLVVAVIGFAIYLQQEKSAPHQLPGEAPSALLMPFIDPILAPLETGPSGFSAETLTDLEERFRTERQNLNRDDKDVYGTAGTIAQILAEAVEDRDRHLERLLRLGWPVPGMAPDPGARTDLSEQERRHLEMAVMVSWQRNSGAYRNRAEELWARLLRLERGRFRSGSAPVHMIGDLPPSYDPSDD